MDNALSRDDGVINNAIEPSLSKKEQAKIWIYEFKRAQAVRLNSTNGSASAAWWQCIGEPLRDYILFTVSSDADWQRWRTSKWSAMPDSLRACIASESRKVVRELDRCPWL